MTTGYELYKNIVSKCLDNYIEHLSSLTSSYRDWIDNMYYTEDDYEEFLESANEVIMCIRSLVDGYLKIACGIADDRFIDKYYDKLLNLLLKGAEARLHQAEDVEDRAEELRNEMDTIEMTEYLYQEYEYMIQACEDIIRELKEDAELLNKLYKEGLKKTTREEKVVFIDKIIHMMHERGGMLPVLCGCVLEEYIKEPGEEEYRPDMFGEFCVEACETAKDILDCIYEYNEGKHIRDIILGILALAIPIGIAGVIKRK